MIFAGSPWWLVAWCIGIGLVFLRARADRRRGVGGLHLAYGAEVIALTLMVLVLLKPVSESRAYAFAKPKVWLAVDLSPSFAGGSTLGLADTVTSGLERAQATLVNLGFDVERLNLSENPASFLQQKLAAAGPEIAAVFYWGDGRDSLAGGSFSAPFFPMRMGWGLVADVQGESAAWQGEADSVRALLLGWMPIGRVKDSLLRAEACLLLSGERLQCWALMGEPSAQAWQVQWTELALNRSSKDRLRKAHASVGGDAGPWALVVRAQPKDGTPYNDTLALPGPGQKGKAVCWPKSVHSLDETAILRLLAASEFSVRFIGENEPCRDAVHAIRSHGDKQTQGGSPSSSRAMPELASARLEVLAPLSQRPAAGYSYFADTSSLSYSAQGRRLLPAALGRLSDISAGGLWLPTDSTVPQCLLQAHAQGRVGCLVGFNADAVFWALPWSWSRLFRESGDPALARRLGQLGQGVLALARLRAAQAVSGGVGDAQGDMTSDQGEMSRLGLDVMRLGKWASTSGGAWMDAGRIGNLQDTVTLKKLTALGRNNDVGIANRIRKTFDFTWIVFAACAGLLFYAWFARSRRFAG
jgi:hypothetical protein